MTDDARAMDMFFAVFKNMTRLGPGSDASTRRAFRMLPEGTEIHSILDIGCGKGAASLLLANLCDARISAVDNHEPFLESLREEASRDGVAERIEALNASMFELPFVDASFDLLWAEGSAYNMGIGKALREWRRLLRPKGYLFYSDAVWLKDHPSPECAAFWNSEYPAISTPEQQVAQAEDLGYRVLDSFVLPRQDWTDYYQDMQQQVIAALEDYGPCEVFEDFQQEIHVGLTYGDEFSYVCLMLQKR